MRLLPVLLAAVCLGCTEPGGVGVSEPPAVYELRGEALGTWWVVKWVDVGGVSMDDVEGATVAALGQVDRGMSTWRDDSDLSRIRAGSGPVPVGEETADVVVSALRIAEATGGAFDPTVQPLMELWGFHGARRTELPSDEEIAAARALLGWDRVEVGRDEAGHATVDAGGTALDLSAIAKGHAVDRVSHALSHLGLAQHMVEVGGEVRAHGPGPSSPHWRIGIDTPGEPTDPQRPMAVMSLTNASVATSGNYRQVYTIGETPIHHTMDPRTGRPAEQVVVSATVLAPDCRTADGWATALMVLGPDEGLALIEARPDLEALVYVPDGEGFASRRTEGISKHLLTVEAGAAGASSP